MKKRILFFTIMFCFVCSLVGCDKDNSYASFETVQVKKLESGVVDSNERLELSWDQKNKRVILTDKTCGTKWSSTPEMELDNNPIESGKKTHPQVDSPIYVTYFDGFNFVEKTAYAYTSAIKKGEVSAEKQEDKISVTYVFESEEFSVTVDYMLRDDNLLVSVDTSKITEGATNIVTEVAIAPFFCSVQNNEQNSYLFVPSGSGALIYSDVKTTQAATTSERVYGEDYTINAEEDFVIYEAVKLPVYGSVRDNRGICAIIEEGAEAASIRTITNQDKMGYATVYANFLTRGYDLVSTPKGFKSVAVKSKLYSEPITNQTYSVAFYPFYGEDASYVDMANIYRGYLEKTYGFSKDSALAKECAINLNIIGGAVCNDFFLGVPYDDFFATTTLDEAENMIEEIQGIAGKLNVSLEGYVGSGIEIDKPAGGIKMNSKLGSVKELSTLYDKYAKDGTSIFLNYDLLQFRKGGSGVSTFFDAAVTTNGKQAFLTVKSLETRLEDKDHEDYQLVARDSIGNLSDKILKYVSKRDLQGVGFNTLSNMIYSDYVKEDYFAALGMEKQVGEILNKYEQQDIMVMGNSANAYAAIHCDYIAEVPIASSDYDSFDVEVPFYQIVFKGYVPMSVPAVNLSASTQSSLLKALESGVGLNYAVINRYNEELVNSSERDFYGMNKDAVTESIQEVVDAGICDVIDAVADVTIEKHIIVNEFVRKTVFSNGVEIWVNYGDTVYSDGNVTVNANHYHVER